MFCKTCKQPLPTPNQVNSLGKRIKRLRKFQGKSLAEISLELSICQSHLSLIENDLRKPSIDNLMKLARLFHVSHDYLIEGS
jgi:transcriptional regulator with XRE-family HTH domain